MAKEIKKEIKEFKIGDAKMPINARDNDYAPSEDSKFVLDKASEAIAEKVLKGAEKDMPVLLIGPTGCGKTSTVKYLAEQTNNGYRRIQLNGSTGIDSFVGRWLINKDGTFWVDGILTDAMRKGHWLLLDEINAALPEILFVMHSIMDDDRRLILDEKDGEMVQPHPDFRLFAAMNPSDEYAGTKELNAALKDRFPIVLEVEYPEEKHEIAIICSHTDLEDKDMSDGRESYAKRMVKFANIIRKHNKDQNMLFHCSTRQLIYWAKLAKDFGVKKAAQMTILNKADIEERKKMVDELNKLFRNDE